MSILERYPKREDFVTTYDYIGEHLNWLSGMSTSFRGHEYRETTHIKVMTLMYEQLRRNPLLTEDKKQWVAMCYFWDDRYISRRTGEVLKSIDEAMTKKSNEVYWAFVTIGFNEQTLTIPKILKVCDRLAHHRYVKHCLYAIEKHRENGVHHHAHFLITFMEKYTSSVIIQDFYKIAGIREIVTNKSFIDVKSPYKKKCICQPYALYDQYIRGHKKQEKMKYVEMDRQWRNDIHIPQLWDIGNQE